MSLEKLLTTYTDEIHLTIFMTENQAGEQESRALKGGK
jgi:hypothetical protein